MRIRPGTGAATSLALGALLAGASVVLGAGTAQAAPQALPVRVSFTELQPGDVRSSSWPVQIAAPAKVASAVLHQDGAPGVRWTARLCPTSGAGTCVDVMTLGQGASVAAGAYVMSVGLTVTGDLQPGQSHSLEARYTFVEDDDGMLADTSGPFGSGRGRSLALTGSAVLPLAASALAATTLGVLLVVLARRRRDDEVPTTDTQETS